MHSFGSPITSLDGWLRKFTMVGAQLFALEDLVVDKYKGKESQGVAEWEKQNPGVVKKLTG